MPESPLAAVVGRLVRGLPPSDGTADDALLARFVGWRDEAAFELLVYRHGPMVRGLCRRVLRHEQDAEDAFQAAFLALAKKAATVRGRSLAGWLYRVAFHAALKARARSVRRGEAELPEVADGDRGPVKALRAQETRAIVDEEVMRLPERFRLPVVLCYLQGRSNSEAAAALGVPKGTVDSRLATARSKLRTRLVRRGLAPAVAAAAVDGLLNAAADAAELPGSVARAVAKSAVAFMSNQPAAGVVPAAAAVLAEGVLHTMFVTKLKWAVAAMLALAVLGSGAGVATYEALAGEERGPKLVVADDPPKPDAQPAQDKPKPAGERPKATSGFAAYCDLLQRPITLDRSIDNAPLRDVLEFLSDKYNVTFLVNTQAFEQAGISGGRNVEDSLVRVPKMPSVSLGAVLRFLLAQVDGTYLIRRDYIEVTTRDRQLVEAYGPATFFEATTQESLASAGANLPPTVNAVFEARPLEKALADLAGQAGKNIVLDPRVQDKEKKLTVSAQLLNTPIDAAVLVVADMIGLEPVTIGNVYYVTTKDNAQRLISNGSVKPVLGMAKPEPPAPSGGK
ncbi:MAG TPA: RNA polymerase sigma factor [Gemmataceae bacterium]|jgi:RNA polymerase sigma factor (sigma-70 family)